MNDDTGIPEEEQTEAVLEIEVDEDASGESAGQARVAWQDVIAQLDALGEAMSRWARAAVDDPDAKRHAEQFSEQMGIVADQVSTAVDDASKTDVGRQFKDAATKTGEAFRKAGTTVSAEVAPRMATALRSAADGLHQAASRMEQKEPPAAESAAPDDDAPDAGPAGDDAADA